MNGIRFAQNGRRHALLAVIMTCCLLWIGSLISGCSADETQDKKTATASYGKEPVQLVYVDWASEIASANVVKAAIEKKLGRECDLLAVSLIAMWESLAAGDRDGMVAAWLPSLQARFLEKFKAEVENLGPNLQGTKIGLVVPEYVNIDSIEELKTHGAEFQHKIIGIDPPAGLMKTTKTAMEEYELDGFELVSGSGATMTAALGNAIEENRWIVVTGWTPHWMFAKWNLKYLRDPENVYGDEEYISTIVRKGLKRDMPDVYHLLDNFKWSPDDMAQVMLKAQDEDTGYLNAARQWVEENESKVNTWVRRE
ncbi:MAG: glycine betaine ABC transporter substrate-binding protein [Desulfarculaceae bacterium]|nr:glycine betaine ABC transporter substrate-binding protein [Desulfarculaceae bacterium]